MHASSPIARVVATLGVLVVVQSGAILRYQHDLKQVTPILPTHSVDVFGARLGMDRLLIFVIGAVLTAALWCAYRLSSFGRITAAVAQGEQTAASMGHSPHTIAASNWMIGAALGAFAGVLIGPVTFLEPNQLVQLIVPALAAALLGGFKSCPLAFVAAATIGVTESVMTLLVTRQGWNAGWSQAVAVRLSSLAVFVVRGKGIPLRSSLFDRLPAVGSGRVRALPCCWPVRRRGAYSWASWANEWAVAFTVTVAFALMCLSLVVVPLNAGQLSLAQFLIGTSGAFVGARLMAMHGVALRAGLHHSGCRRRATRSCGRCSGPAHRAASTWRSPRSGLGVALYALVLNNFGDHRWSHRPARYGPPSLLGWNIDPEDAPAALRQSSRSACCSSPSLGVANLRRGAAGRRLLAVRSERAVGRSGGCERLRGRSSSRSCWRPAIAGVGGCILAFLNPNVVFGRFDLFTSISVVTATVVGGLGFIGGAVLGSTLIAGGLTSRLLDSISNLGLWLGLIGGVLVIVILRFDQDGLFAMNRRMFARLVGALRRERSSHPRGHVDGVGWTKGTEGTTAGRRR